MPRDYSSTRKYFMNKSNFSPTHVEQVIEWLGNHKEFCLAMNLIYRYKKQEGIYVFTGNSLYRYENYKGELIEEEIKIEVEFQFEFANLRKVQLLWQQEKQSAACDMTHMTDKECYKWITGLLRTRHGKFVVWPCEFDLDMILGA